MRTVHQAEALAWLSSRGVLEGCSVITSLPDVSELQRPLEDWKTWFRGAAVSVMQAVPRDGVALFFQTDIKWEGTWVDKGYLVSRAAEDAGLATLFHRVVCRAPPGAVTHGRPGWSHLLAFSRDVRLDLSRSLPDVLPDAGATTWTRGMGRRACELACRFVLTHTKSHTVVDPFCGHGSVLAVANHLGLEAVGVELSPKRARKARNLTWEALEAAEAS
jgi:hypothetical protein